MTEGPFRDEGEELATLFDKPRSAPGRLKSSPSRLSSPGKAAPRTPPTPQPGNPGRLLVVAMGASYLGLLYFLQVPVHVGLFQAIGFAWLELVVLTSLTMVFSTFQSASVCNLPSLVARGYASFMNATL